MKIVLALLLVGFGIFSTINTPGDSAAKSKNQMRSTSGARDPICCFPDHPSHCC